jgi:lipoate-protein ligase A
MEAEASLKVPDGKMVKISAEVEDQKVIDAEIRGDFFLQPPEKLEELQDKLTGLPENASREKITDELENVDAELIGFSREDVAEALRKALKGDE